VTPEHPHDKDGRFDDRDLNVAPKDEAAAKAKRAHEESKDRPPGEYDDDNLNVPAKDAADAEAKRAHEEQKSHRPGSYADKDE